MCAPVEEEDSYTVGNARIGYDSAGAWSVAAFVNNVTEEEYRVYAFDSSLFAGVVAGCLRAAARPGASPGRIASAPAAEIAATTRG